VVCGLLGFIVMIFDQNLTIILVNASDHKLKKGYGYDLDCMALAICTVLLSVVGCPWLVSATVPSLNHVKSLAYYDGDGKKKDDEDPEDERKKEEDSKRVS
jgi:hypothetical protein